VLPGGGGGGVGAPVPGRVARSPVSGLGPSTVLVVVDAAGDRGGLGRTLTEGG
jgi:hypothetical protein